MFSLNANLLTVITWLFFKGNADFELRETCNLGT